MKILRRLALLGLAAALVAGTALPAQAKPKSNEDDREGAKTYTGRQPKHVVLIDWDGFDPDFLGRAPTPNLDALVARGSMSIARSTFQTVSNPARASMSTGAYPDVHENAAYYFDPAANVARGQERFLAAETIAEVLAAEGRTLASVQWYMVQNHGATYGDPEHLYVQPGGSFENRVNVAIDILNRRPVDSGGQAVTVPEIPDFLAVYSDAFDALAHREGTESPNIAVLLAEMDRQLGRLVQATKDVGIYGETAFILTTDHGMTSWNQTLIPQVLAAVSAAGYRPEIVSSGRSPLPETEVIIVPNAVRVGDVTLRGRAATPEGRTAVKAALQSLSPTYISTVFGQTELEAMRASDKLGDLVAEAQPPYGFATSVPPPGEWRASHGSTAELPIPFLVSGAGFRRGVPPTDPVIVDVAPTIALLLGVRAPAQAQGRAWVESIGPPSPRAPGTASPQPAARP
ncbi:MAG: alkaline phosphatase family protein [Actinomycetota bacterium]|nr:alkaline phosphatase family protein [Actinomycetota bacterium]